MSQNRAVSVCCAERFTLVLPPWSFSSLKSVAHSWLSNEIGGFGRNCDGLAMANGFRFGHIEAAVIGVGT